VILVDTGYLFPETYRYADQLVDQLALNLKVYRPQIGIAWMEARFGKLWESGSDGCASTTACARSNRCSAHCNELGVRSWFAGLRRDQARTREGIEFLELRDGRWKLHPIADWNDIDVGAYMLQHDLPEHPLAGKGYVSIGDVHTTQPLRPGMDYRADALLRAAPRVRSALRRADELRGVSLRRHRQAIK
jgi:phosphoadenosine phosphosulfate reductase